MLNPYLLLLIPAMLCATLGYRRRSRNEARRAYAPYHRWLKAEVLKAARSEVR